MFQYSFLHGLGDAVHFACAAKLYIDRGHDLRFKCHADRELLFRAAGCKEAVPITKNGQYCGATLIGFIRDHFYPHPGVSKETPLNVWSNNKLATNLRDLSLPFIGHVWDLWDEVCSVKLSLAEFLTDEQREKCDRFISHLGQYVCVHSRGESNAAQKNLPRELEERLIFKLVEMGFNVLMIDEKGLMNHLRCEQVRSLAEYGATSLPELWYLLSRCRCMVGIDSGPYHLMRFTDVPAIGCWFHFDPGSFALPRPLNVNLTVNGFRDQGGIKQKAFNIHQGAITADTVGGWVTRLTG